MSNKEICSIKPTNQKRIISVSIFCGLLVAFILAPFLHIILVTVIGILLIRVTYLTFKTSQKHILVYEDSIVIQYPLTTISNKTILTSSISEVLVSDRVTLFWKQGHLKRKINLSERFALGEALKFWYLQGIPIKNIQKDNELDQFLTGKISEYPMKNK